MARTLVILIITIASTSFAASQTGANNDWTATSARLTQLLSGNSEQKRTALAEIRNLRTEQASRLAIPALTDGDEIVRATAASSVVFLPDGEAATALLPVLDDKRPFVRREAAYALGRVGNRAATSRLRRLMLNDRDLEVRSAAAVAIGNLGDHAAMEDLLTVLAKRPKEEEEFLRRSATRAIGQIFELRATGSTRALTPQSFLPPKFKELGSAADPNAQLAPQQLERVAAALTNVIRGRGEADDTRREAAFALGAMRRPESTTLLKSLLSSPDPYLVEISNEALLKIGSQE